MLSRRELLQRGAAVAGPAFVLGRVPGAVAQPGKGVAGMNIIVFITDQERAIQHFPRDWARTHLPGPDPVAGSWTDVRERVL